MRLSRSRALELQKEGSQAMIGKGWGAIVVALLHAPTRHRLRWQPTSEPTDARCAAKERGPVRWR
jgi:hypothetical protein